VNTEQLAALFTAMSYQNDPQGHLAQLVIEMNKEAAKEQPKQQEAI